MYLPKYPDEPRQAVTLRAAAKVNLFLEILGKRADGFHEISTVMSAVSLYDTLHIQARNDDSITLTVDQSALTSLRPSELDMAAGVPHVPTDSGNLVVQAVKRFLSATQGTHTVAGVDIHLMKQIPVAAGLGGASSNAATALLAMQQLTRAQLPCQTMHEIATELGSDVPFFLNGGTAVCSGRGEQISPLTSVAGIQIVIVRPASGLSTPAVYARVQRDNHNPANEMLSPMLDAVQAGESRKIGGAMSNRLQQPACELNPDIEQIRFEFDRLNCLGHQLSGSGSCYFGIFSSRRMATIAANQLSNRLSGMKVYRSQTIGPEQRLAV